MTGLQRWAAGRLSVHIVDPRRKLRVARCTLLRQARVERTPFTDAAAMRAGHAQGAPDLLIVGPGADRHGLDAARARRPHLRTTVLSPAIRVGDGSTFSPLRGLLGMDFLLSYAPDGAGRLAALVLAAAEIDNRGALAIAS